MQVVTSTQNLRSKPQFKLSPKAFKFIARSNVKFRAASEYNPKKKIFSNKVGFLQDSPYGWPSSGFSVSSKKRVFSDDIQFDDRSRNPPCFLKMTSLKKLCLKNDDVTYCLDEKKLVKQSCAEVSV